MCNNLHKTFKGKQMKSLLAIIFLALTAITPAQAQTGFDPANHTIEIVVPYPPGGATDKWGRVINEIFICIYMHYTLLEKCAP